MLTRPMDAMDREGCPIHNKASFSPDDLQRMRGGHCTNCGQCIYAGSGPRVVASGAAALPVVR